MLNGRQGLVSRTMVALAALIALACLGGTARAGTDNAKPLVIGVSVSMSGDFSDESQGTIRGYKVWQSLVNKSGGLLGRKVEFKFVDDGSNPDTAVSNYQSLITKDHVDLVFGPYSTLLEAPASVVAHRYGYAFPDPASGAPATLSLGFTNYFLMQRAGPLDTGTSFIRYIKSLPPSERPKTAAYPAIDDPFLGPAIDEMKAAFERIGIKTVYSDTYGTENIQMLPIVAAMKAAAPDMVIGGTHADDCFDMVKAMIQEQFNPKFLFFMTGPDETGTFPQNVGAQNTSGIFSATDWYPQEKTPGNAQFVKQYLKMYGGQAATIDDTVAEGFTVGQVIGEVIEKIHSADNAKVIAALHAHAWPSVQGNLSWDKQGIPNNGLLLLEWIGPKSYVVYPKSSASHKPAIPKPAWP